MPFNPNILVIIILLVNTNIAVLVFIFSFLKKDLLIAMQGLLVLLCPILGPLYFAFSYLQQKTSFSPNKVKKEDISFSKIKMMNMIMPDINEEISTIPLEEAFIVSGTREKRIALMAKLKKNYNESLGTIYKALENADSETSHYAASVIMNATNEFIKNIKEKEIAYEKDRTNSEANREYMEIVDKYYNSGMLSKIEKKKYSYLYVKLVDNLEKNSPHKVEEEDYERLLDHMLFLKQHEYIEKLILRYKTYFPTSENAYLGAMKYYYITGQSEKFRNELKSLKESNIPISENGLNTIRFFS